MSASAETNASSTLQRRSCHVEDQSQVWVVFDTGSTNLWVASDLCTTGACAKDGRRRYNHTLSASYQRPSVLNELHIQFGTGSIAGPQGIEDFHVGPFTVYNQTFGLIQTQQGRVFEEVPFEGILGLAYPSMSAGGVTPFFDNIIHQKALGKSEFSFYFSLDNPSSNAVLWGGVDPAFHRGKVEYFHVVDPYYWSLNLHSFKIGNETLAGEGSAVSNSFLEGASSSGGEGLKAIVDTGTTFFTAETGVFEQVMQRIPAAECGAITDESHPPMTYTLEASSGEARDFVLTNKQYMTQTQDGKRCTPAFMRINVPAQHGPAMLLGEVFLRHYFSVFDRSEGPNGAVGFAPSIQGDDVARHLKSLTRHQPRFASKSPKSAGAESEAADK